MTAILERTDYRLSHLTADKARRYDYAFSRNPWRAYLWRREQQVLEKVLHDHFPAMPATHLDFACGTGRILRFLGGRTGRSVGLDLSAEMLRIAAAQSPGVQLIQADITRNDVLGQERFDLITAFRFLPNAQEDLRVEALRTLAAHLLPGGRLVFNNHKNHSSLLYRLGRMMGKHTTTLSHRHVMQLIRQAGLEILETHPLGILPATDSHRLVPAFIHRACDAALGSRSVGLKFAQNIVYVCALRGATGGLSASADPHWRTSRQWHPKQGSHTAFQEESPGGQS
jgi:SAM-dependent methyltransferase